MGLRYQEKGVCSKGTNDMQRITPSLTFANEAEEAVNFYVSIFAAVFGNSKVLNVTRYGEEELEALSHLPEDIRPGPAGSVKTVRFDLNGQEFMAANGGPFFKFSEGITLYVGCETQEEIDELWEKLSEGGEKQECGWLKDKYGVTWQIGPATLWELIEDPDMQKSQRVMRAIYGMTKLEIQQLKRAYEGE